MHIIYLDLDKFRYFVVYLLLMKVPKILKVVTSRFYCFKRGTKGGGGKGGNTVKL